MENIMKKLGKIITIISLLIVGAMVCSPLTAAQNSPNNQVFNSSKEINDGEIPDATENLLDSPQVNGPSARIQNDGTDGEKPGEELQDDSPVNTTGYQTPGDDTRLEKPGEELQD